MLIKICLSGDGGQGVQLISDIICLAAFVDGWQVSQIPNYGLEQRGGVSLSFIKISDQEITYPKFSQPDILLIMSAQARERTKRYSEISNIQFPASNQIQNPNVKGENIKILDIENYKDILHKENIKFLNYNIFFLGLLSKILEEKNICKIDEVVGLLEKKLIDKAGWNENKRAFEIGVDIEY